MSIIGKWEARESVTDKNIELTMAIKEDMHCLFTINKTSIRFVNMLIALQYSSNPIKMKEITVVIFLLSFYFFISYLVYTQLVKARNFLFVFLSAGYLVFTYYFQL